MFMYPVILNGGTERIYKKFDKKMYVIAGVGLVLVYTVNCWGSPSNAKAKAMRVYQRKVIIRWE